MRSHSRLVRFLFLACILTSLIGFVGCRLIGDFGDDKNPVAGTTTTTVTPTTPTTTSNNVTLSGVLSDTTETSASIRRSIHLAVVSSATVSCSFFDDSGIKKELASGTTDSSGNYVLNKLPPGLKNVIVEGIKNGASYSVVVPALPDVGENASAVAPIMNKDTYRQVEVIKECVGKGMKPKDISLGDLMSILPPETLAKLSKDELKNLASNLKDRFDAREKTKSEFKIDENLYKALNEFAQKLAQKIQEGIAKGDPNFADGFEKVFRAELEAKARSLGLPADALMAFQQIDKEMFGAKVQLSVSGNTDAKAVVEKSVAVKKYNETLSALIQALKDLGTVSASEISSLEQMFKQLVDGMGQTTASDMPKYMNSHPGAPIAIGLMRQAFKNLGLFDGNPPLIAALGPKPGDATKAGLTWEPPFPPPPTPPTPPTFEQMSAFQKFVRDTIVKNIQSNAVLLAKLGGDTKKLGALIFLIFGPRDIGIDPSTFTSTGSSGTVATGSVDPNNMEIMGIIKKLSPAVTVKGVSYDYSIKPPEGFPLAPAEMGGLLGYLRAGTGVTITESASDKVEESYLVKVTMESLPAGTNQPPAFVVNAIRKNTNTSVGPQFDTTVDFTGTLYLKDGTYFLSSPDDTTLARAWAILLINTADLKALASTFVGKMVHGQGKPTQRDTTKTGLLALPKCEVVFLELNTRDFAALPGAPNSPTGQQIPGGNLNILMQGVVKKGTAGFILENAQINEFNVWKPYTSQVVNLGTSPSVTTAMITAAEGRGVVVVGTWQTQNGQQVFVVVALQGSAFGPTGTTGTTTQAAIETFRGILVKSGTSIVAGIKAQVVSTTSAPFVLQNAQRDAGNGVWQPVGNLHVQPGFASTDQLNALVGQNVVVKGIRQADSSGQPVLKVDAVAKDFTQAVPASGTFIPGGTQPKFLTLSGVLKALATGYGVDQAELSENGVKLTLAKTQVAVQPDGEFAKTSIVNFVNQKVFLAGYWQTDANGIFIVVSVAPATPPTGTATGTFQPPASGTYVPPASGTYKPPASGTYVPPATGTYQPPASGTYVPPATGTYQPPASGTYVPPATGTYQPPASSTYVPPASGTYQPPASSTYVPPASGTATPPASGTFQLKGTLTKPGSILEIMNAQSNQTGTFVTLTGVSSIKGATTAIDTALAAKLNTAVTLTGNWYTDPATSIKYFLTQSVQ